MVYEATHCECGEKGSNLFSYIIENWIVIGARYNVYLRNFIRSDWSADVYYTCYVQKCNKCPYRLKHELKWIWNDVDLNLLYFALFLYIKLCTKQIRKLLIVMLLFMMYVHLH